ncbi:TPA: hypothetical protein ACPJZ8_004438 [Vibrio diabolicus]|uniref:hypothetical protein n=3 Tax=Vibrio diabolicus TaxID=50719 RepID=UPI00215F840C|nr:hypothetical protein [Vibrio diabolicus]MCS0393564.1 hypothetical protein [Vibrio diabolicus]MCS0454368.1 hypothetical protein [Vibrio diabolicus]
MELQQFVKEALTQITLGVKEAQADIRDAGGCLNPAVRISHQPSQSHVSSLSDGQNIYTVDFDIAISVTENSDTSADGKLTVASVLSFGGGASSSESNSTLSKIAFKVPLALPVDPVSSQKLKTEDLENQKAMDKFINQSCDSGWKT